MDERQVVKVAKALSDTTRYRLLQTIALSGEISCGRLAEHFQITHATVSHHLKILADSKLIDLSRKGQFSYARVISNTLGNYYRALDLALCLLTKVEKGDLIANR